MIQHPNHNTVTVISQPGQPVYPPPPQPPHPLYSQIGGPQPGYHPPVGYPPPGQQHFYQPGQHYHQPTPTSNVVVVEHKPVRPVVIHDRRPGVNHALHCIITFFFWPWIIVWLILCQMEGEGKL